MRLCLVYPSTRHMISTNVPTAVDEVTGRYPPLGILYVAGAVERVGRHEVCVIDASAEELDGPGLEERIRRCAPDVVGVQAITFSMVDALEVAGAVKRINPATPVVMGGPHVNLFPEETVALPGVDYLLLGEGESNINPFLEALSGHGAMEGVPGVVYRQDGVIRRGPANPLIEDLDSVPMPARHLLNGDLYSSVLGRGKRLTTIMSSRGCPARCIFCDRPHLGKRFRARSAGNVVTEMALCREQFGVDEFFFYDDTFTIDRDRVFAICRAVRERGLNVYWDIRARISNMDREMIEALRAAGCVRIHFGIESGNEAIQKTLRKGVDLQRAREVLHWCRQTGIESLAYFMVGSPGEGLAEVHDTVRYALSLECDYVHVSVMTPFPGTDLYRLGLEKGVFDHDYWREFARNPSPKFKPEFWNEVLPRDELIHQMMNMYRRFYLRPGCILRRLSRVRNGHELLIKSKAGMKLLFR